jgi:hypothetical protein
MNDINLDINTYSLNELENLLKLPKNYDENNIIDKKNKLQNILSKSFVNPSKKENLLIFLDNIKNKLTENLYSNIKNLSIIPSQDYQGNHFTINDNNTVFPHTLESNKLIDKSIIKKTYTIDSLFRQNYDNTDNKSHDYIIQLPETITKAITMSISCIEIPLTYHNVSEIYNNNAFKIEVLDASHNVIDASSTLVELTSGLYESRFSAANSLTIQNQATFSTQVIAANIRTEINDKIKATNIPDICSNFSFDINPESGFSFFKYDTSSGGNILNGVNKIRVNFNVDNSQVGKNCSENLIYQKLGWQLGYRVNNIVLDASTTYLHSAGVCYINYPRYGYIAIDDFQSTSRNHFSIASSSIIAPNIISKINLLSLLEEKTAFKQGAAPGDFLYSQKHVREYFGPTDINRLKISLLDEYGRPLSLNNMDWSFILSFECFYN